VYGEMMATKMKLDKVVRQKGHISQKKNNIYSGPDAKLMYF
jgi:hypothetical protein